MRMMLTALVLSALAFTGARAETTIDRVMATVGQEVILMSDLLAELGPVVDELRLSSESQEAFEQALDERVEATLQQAIDSRILMREGMLAGIEVSDDLVDKRIEELKKLYPSEDDFRKELEANGETMGELRDRVRKQLLAQRMAFDLNSRFSRSISVSEADVRAFYEANNSQFNKPERVRCSQIFLGAGANRDETRARAEGLKAELDGGADFAELARQHSNAPGAADGGLIGWVARGDLVTELEQAVFALQPGEVSGVVETANGFHILKAGERQAAGTATLEEVRTDIEPAIRAQAAAEMYEKWISDLRNRSQVRVFQD